MVTIPNLRKLGAKRVLGVWRNLMRCLKVFLRRKMTRSHKAKMRGLKMKMKCLTRKVSKQPTRKEAMHRDLTKSTQHTPKRMLKLRMIHRNLKKSQMKIESLQTSPRRFKIHHLLIKFKELSLRHLNNQLRSKKRKRLHKRKRKRLIQRKPRKNRK